ncbi:MAG: CopG family ribbon-helix-helix protein [Thermoplasmata archaeon]|nr:CopG family ribbon-helix-helix protein [Thermoplasmata archaeon]
MRGHRDDRPKNGTSVISISLPTSTVAEMGAALEDMGFVSRSELVRDALREFMREKRSVERLDGKVQGVMVLLYHHDASGRVSDVRHRHREVFRSFTHSDFDSRAASCCEVLLFSGEAKEVTAAYFELKGVRGVLETHIYVAPAV